MNAPEFQRDTTRRDIALAFLGAFVFRLLFMAAMPRVLDSADAIHYLEVAGSLRQGRLLELAPAIPLLYPALCALANLVVSDMEWAGVSVSLLSGSLVVLPLYLLSRDLHGRATARVAVLVAAIWPWLADYSLRVAPESLALLLWLSAVWLLAKAACQGGWWPLWAALSFFALHLTRPEGTFLLLAAPGAALILCWRSDTGKYRRIIPFIVIAALLLAGYAIFMRQISGHATVSARYKGVSTAHYLFEERGLGTILGSAAASFTDILPVMLGPVLLVFAGAGLFMAGERRRDTRLELTLLFFCLTQWALAVLSTYAQPRYLMPVIVAISLWSARGVALVSRQALQATGRRLVAALPLLAVVGVMTVSLAATVLPEHMGRPPREPREYKLAGLWMKEHLEPALIMTRKPQVGFYAGMSTTGPAAEDSVTDAIARARRVGARYLVVDERYTAQLIPGLRALLEPANAPDSLRLIRDDLSPYPNARIVIYEVVSP